MPGWCGNGLMLFLKSLGVGLDRFGAAWRLCCGNFGDFLSFLPTFRPFLAFFAILGPGGPQIGGEGNRFDARMVREWTNNVFYVDWSRVGTVWSRLEAVLGRVLAIFCHFLPILVFLGPKISLSVKTPPCKLPLLRL